MAKHDITFKLPPLDLGKQDIVFEIHIDAKKAGQLHISQGGLLWRPAHAKTTSFTATWAKLRNFMESQP